MKHIINILMSITKRKTVTMGKHFFDFEDGDFVHTIPITAVDSDGNMIERMSDNMAMDLDSRRYPYHFILVKRR